MEKELFSAGYYFIIGILGAYVVLSLLIRFVGWLIDPNFKPYKR